MNYKEFERELRIKYGKHRKTLSDPFELLDLAIDIRELNAKDKEKAIEIAEEIYFNYDVEKYESMR